MTGAQGATGTSSAASIYINFDTSLPLGANKKIRYILPAPKTITASTIIGRTDGNVFGSVAQLYTFGDKVTTRIVAVGAQGAGATGPSAVYSGTGNLYSWTIATTISPTNGPFSTGVVNTVFWTGSSWLAGANGTNTIARSTNGITWTGIGAPIATSVFCFTQNDSGTIIAGGQGASGGVNMVYSTDDGVSWSNCTSPFYTKCTCLDWNGQVFMAGGQTLSPGSGTNSLYYNLNATGTWTATTNSFQVGGSAVVSAVKWNGSYWLAAGNNNAGTALLQYAYLYTGTFTTISGVTCTDYSTIAWNGQQWLIGETNTDAVSGILYSYNGQTWTKVTAEKPRNIMWDGTQWFAVGGTAAANNIRTSMNGIDWEIVYTGFSSYCSAIAHNNLRRPNRMVIPGGGNTAAISFSGGGSSLTTSDLEIVDNGGYYNGGYSNFLVRID